MATEALVIPAALFVGSLAVLLGAADAFTDAAEELGVALGVPPFVVGVTVVAGGTSLPELVGSTLAVVRGASEIVVGTVVGSNVTNILLVLGLAAVAGRDLRVTRELVDVDLPLLVGSAVFLVVAAWNGRVDWFEGVLALAALGVYLHFTVAEKDRYVDMIVGEMEVPDEAPEAVEVRARTVLALAGSLVLVVGSATVLVDSMIGLASGLGVGPEIVALTAFALGTSLPELLVSVSAARKELPGMAVGNVLGSNIYNSLLVVGVPSLLGPLAVPSSLLDYGLPVMLLATVLYFFTSQDRQITRWEGVTLVVLYGLFLVNLGAVA